MLDIEVISSAEGLAGLQRQWRELWARCPAASPFQSPEWLLPWWRVFGAGSELAVLAVSAQGRLVGLLPFFIRDSPPRLHLLGWGISDYLDVLVEPTLRAPVLVLAFETLLGLWPAWQVAELDDLPGSSALLSTALPAGLRAAVRSGPVCPVVALPASVEAFHARLSGQQRYHIRQTRRRVEESFHLSLHLAGQQDLPTLLEELFGLHGRRWRQREQAGVLQAEAIRQFHRQAAPGLLAGGLLELYALRLDATTAAALYVLCGHGRLYGYISGFEPALERFSPGLIALDLVIGAAIGRGMTEFDFLRGEEPYKYLWGARNRMTYAMTLLPGAAASKEER